MKQKILIARVPEIQVVSDDDDFRNISVTKLMVPLGLPYLGATIRDAGLHDVVLLDLYAEDHDFYLSNYSDYGKMVECAQNRLLLTLNAYRPNIVGLSALFTFQHNFVQRLARMIKQWDGNVKLYLGGYPTVSPDLVIRDIPEVDVIFLGESEDKINNVLSSESSATPYVGINGILYRDGDNIIKTPREFNIKNIDDIPWPAFDMLPIKKYREIQGRGEFPFLTSRSCPFSCSYCSSQLYSGRVWRSKSLEKMLDEVGFMIDEYGLDFMWVVDEIFNVNKKHSKGFLKGMIERGYNIEWWDNNAFNVNCLDEELLDLCKETNNVHIVMSVESASQRVLNDIMNKRVDLDHARKMVDYATSIGLPSTVNFVIGSPGETRDEIQETIDYASELKTDGVVFSLATPFPGTRYYDLATENGLLINGEEYILNLKYMEVSMASDEFSAEWLKDTQYGANIRINFLGNRLLKGSPEKLIKAREKFGTVYNRHKFHAIARLLEGYAEGLLGNNKRQAEIYAHVSEMLSDPNINSAYGQYFDWDFPATASYKQWLSAAQ